MEIIEIKRHTENGFTTYKSVWDSPVGEIYPLANGGFLALYNDGSLGYSRKGFLTNTLAIKWLEKQISRHHPHNFIGEPEIKFVDA